MDSYTRVLRSTTYAQRRYLRSSSTHKSGQSGEKVVKRLHIRKKKPGTRQGKRRRGAQRQTTIKDTKRTILSTVAINEYELDNSRAPLVWSVKEKHEYNIQVPCLGEPNNAWISGCHRHYSHNGEIIMTDFLNKKIKKLDRETLEITMCDLPLPPVDMCYIGANIVAISLGRKLQFVDVSGDMKLTRSVDQQHYCKGMTYHSCTLFTISDNSIFMHDRDGNVDQCIYAHHSKHANFQSLTFNSMGTTLFISSSNLGLVVLNVMNECKHVLSNNIEAPSGISRDEDDNIFVCLSRSQTVIQISPDGKKKMGDVVKKDHCIQKPRSLYFDRHTNTLVVGCEGEQKVYVLQLC